MDIMDYNLTIRLGSLLSLPSKFIHRLRRIDDMLEHGLEAHQTAALQITTAAQGSSTYAARPPPAPNSLSYELAAMPGTFAFLTSGYAIGLVAMTLVLNRIQHIVVPPRRSMAYRIIQSRRSILHALFYTFFPIDLSSTTYRLCFRIPSLYVLFRSLALLSVVLLQVTGYFPSTQLGWLHVIEQWAGQKEMSDVCWTAFVAVCLALVVDALTRGLEGANSNSSSQFNLFGYAMLLHIYSVPVTHVIKGPPSRPDKNVLFTLFLPLLQLTMVHALGVKRRWSRYRLVPTSICSLVTLAHFNAVLLTKPASYPLINYLPCLLETTLLFITLLTISLNALTQLLLEGEVSRPLFGHTRTLAPKWDEDFAIALLRLGTASLEATSVAGLGNEVAPVAVGVSQEVIPQIKSKGKVAELDDGVIEMTSAGVLSLVPSKSEKGGRRLNEGFANEIKSIRVKMDEGGWLIDYKWLRELRRFGRSLVGVMRGFCRVALWAVWYKWRGVALSRPVDANVLVDTPVQPDRTLRVYSPGSDDGEGSIYRRFLRGENVSDDEDDYLPLHDHISEDSPNVSTHASDEEDEPEAEDSDVGNGLETADLYSDILTASASSSLGPPGPVLLAHMTTISASPLTRRRYKQLVSDPRRQVSTSVEVEREKDEWTEFVQSRQARVSVASPENGSLEGRMNCVICTAEPREIICWPCRCLALCNDCRENLASRFSASKHSCPCCRRSVEGYSKIYIP
ncbi:hypothetical protein M0805_002714 [Coniferiporia weirii]|nr:hypothetical protein M0805_002714 [Coniferiporia weirii]